MRVVSRKHYEYLYNPLKRLPYQLIPFFLSMFVIVVAFNYQNITSSISDFLGNKNTIWVYGYSSFLMSNVINNIPMSILFSNIASMSTANYMQATYASIIGSNIGAFLTPLGALAGIMFSSLVNKNGIKFRFVDFVMYGVIIAIPTITLSLSGLLITIR